MTQQLADPIATLMPQARDDLAQLVSFPSVADPPDPYPQACRQVAAWVAKAFAGAGLDTDLKVTPDGSQAVVGHRPAPPGAPTVLLYCHHDVQPAGDAKAWLSDPFTLTERADGRWYGRGSADCKGNIVAHLTALRALGDDLPVGVTLVSEGSEEQGTGGLEKYVPQHPDELRADAILVCDTGNIASGIPTVTTSLRGVVTVSVQVDTLAGGVHSGMFGGPAPDALGALVRMLDSLRDDDGGTRIRGLDCDGHWHGTEYDEKQFRGDAHVLDGVSLTGSGSVADRLWARPAVTVLTIDCSNHDKAVAAVPSSATARVSLRVPPGTDPGEAQGALTAQLRKAAPWGARVAVTAGTTGAPFTATTSGPAYKVLGAAMETAYGLPMVEAGQGGSIPLCNVLATTFPDSEIALMGVEEPQCRIHAPNESVDPGELKRTSLAEALFLTSYAR